MAYKKIYVADQKRFITSVTSWLEQHAILVPEDECWLNYKWKVKTKAGWMYMDDPTAGNTKELLWMHRRFVDFKKSELPYSASEISGKWNYHSDCPKDMGFQCALDLIKEIERITEQPTEVLCQTCCRETCGSHPMWKCDRYKSNQPPAKE